MMTCDSAIAAICRRCNTSYTIIAVTDALFDKCVKSAQLAK